MKKMMGMVGGLSPKRASTSKDVGGSGGGGGSSESGGVNTQNWSFYGRGRSNSDQRPAPYLVGPVVGAVTGTTARILVEMADAHDVTAEAFMNTEIVWTQTKQVAGKKPTIFVVENLVPGERVRVTFNVGEFGQEREARFVTPSDKEHWKIGVVSCNCHSRMEPIGLWEKLSKVVAEVDCIVHLGDQVYADMDLVARQDPSARFNSAWTACLAIIDLAPPDQWESHREQLLECYRRTYRLTWNFPPLAQVLASTSNYMICDDHEVVDDLGDEEEHTNQSSPEFFVIKCAYQVYLEYQKQLLCDVDVLDSGNRAYYGVKIGPRVGLFMSDNRVERSLHRTEGTDEEWRDKTFLGPNQWSALNKSFANDFKDCDCVLFGAPTPLVFLSQSATNMAVKVVDDARGTWGHKQFKAEQKALCATLSEWQTAAPNRAVITLAGDVHVGGFTDSWHNKCSIPLHQMTASAVGNIPEGKLDAMKKVVIRKTMAADQMFFPFKVRHGDWILGPNFGLVDVIVGKESKRPDVTLTLVPHEGAPKVRNLTLGDSAVSKTKCDQHEAAQNAHTTAALMR